MSVLVSVLVSYLGLLRIIDAAVRSDPSGWGVTIGVVSGVAADHRRRGASHRPWGGSQRGLQGVDAGVFAVLVSRGAGAAQLIKEPSAGQAD